MPDAPNSDGKKKAPPEKSRRRDIEQYAGRVITPQVESGGYLLAHFFQMGPAGVDGPITMTEVREWSPALIGMDEWAPWHAALFVRLSREYCMEQQAAKQYDAEPPWPGAAQMWRWVQAQKMNERAQTLLAQKLPKGGAQRR